MKKSSFLRLVAVVSASFVLHLEHDRDDLGARLGQVPEDVVALAAGARVVVLFEVRLRERGRPDLIERRLAVLFERFTQHLCRQSGLHVFQALNGFVAILQLSLVLVVQRPLGLLLRQFERVEFVLQSLDLRILSVRHLLELTGLLRFGQFLSRFTVKSGPFEFVSEPVAFGFELFECLADRQLLLRVAGIKLGFELGDVLVFLELGGFGFAAQLRFKCCVWLSCNFSASWSRAWTS